jgi:hypothetical protein
MDSSSIVISFSIAVLLLLTLLLLISYNSKCKMDNIERFETDNYMPSQQMVNSILKQSGEQTVNGVAGNSYVNLESAANGGLGSIGPSDSSPGLTSLSGDFISQAQSQSALVGQSGQLSQFTGDTTVDAADSCFVRDRLTSSDLLPKDSANSKFAQINPAGSGMLGDQNFLTAGYHVGINTIGQSLRNANLQLRSEPPNPQVAVSPWGISTIEPDVRAVAFEIGSAPS